MSKLDRSSLEMRRVSLLLVRKQVNIEMQPLKNLLEVLDFELHLIEEQLLAQGKAA